MNKNTLRFFMSALLIALCALNVMAQKVKVACVGNSVTYGYLLPDREHEAYPTRLQEMLGDGYEVGNFGKSGATLLRHGHRPYNEQPEYQAAMDFGAEIAVIHLGLNDTDPRNWPNYRDEFESDYQRLIDDLNAAAPGGHLKKLVICRMTPIFHGHSRFKSGTRDWHGEIQQAIERVARRNGLETLDINTPLHCRPDLFPDALHPNAEGALILAKTVYGGVTGDWGGLALADVYSNGMVLQHDKPVFRGRANVGEKVTVSVAPAASLSKSDRKKYARQTASAIADTNGRWEVALDALKPGGPYTVTLTSAGKTIVLDDVLAGEVWLCSGQSNMAFRLNQCVTAKEDIAAAPAHAAGAAPIRFYDMKERWATDNTEWPAEALDAVNGLQYYRPAQWTHCSEETAALFSAVGYHFGRVLADSLQMPIGLINNAIGGSTAESWVDRTTIEYEFPDILTDWQRNDFIQDWCRGRAAKNMAQALASNKVPATLVRHPYLPCYLFETGIAPLDAFPIKGVVWYQGESNAHNKEAHERLFRLLVRSWRHNWQDNDLPFHFVQLSSLNRPSWTWFRDSQRRLARSIPHCSMAVSSDLGDSLDVHPRFKREVGERLARLALNDDYGFKNVVSSGPEPQRAAFEGGAVTIHFTNGKGMRAAGKDSAEGLKTFEVAGADGIFYPAEAVVTSDRTIVVRSAEVGSPVSVRYGWQPFTRANLVNAEGLPCTTFRLDKRRK